MKERISREKLLAMQNALNWGNLSNATRDEINLLQNMENIIDDTNEAHWLIILLVELMMPRAKELKCRKKHTQRDTIIQGRTFESVILAQRTIAALGLDLRVRK